jgi:hypothetical protein
VGSPPSRRRALLEHASVKTSEPWPELRIPAILNIPLGAGTECSKLTATRRATCNSETQSCSGLACTGTGTSTGTGTGTGAGTGKAAVLQQALRHISLLLLLFAARLAARLPVYPLGHTYSSHRPSSIVHRGDEGSASRRPCCPIAPRGPVEHVSNIHHSSQ